MSLNNSESAPSNPSLLYRTVILANWA